MIPGYLNDLHLPCVFGTNSNAVDRHILETTKNEHIVDSETLKVSGFVSATFGQQEESLLKYFSVENPSSRPYSLIQIDNAIIKTPTIKRCDCALANDIHLCFIEFKANAVSLNNSVIERNYKKAIEQIVTTKNMFFTYFAAKGIDFLSLRSIEAFICFRHGYPRNTSSQMNYRVAFAAANGGIPLSFERKKVL